MPQPPPPPLSSPPSLSMPPTTTTPAQSQSINAHAPPLQQTLPSSETQRHVSEARAAVVASMGNLLDSELQSRAGILHDNAAALDKQERDVLRATEGLRKEREKLAKEADNASRKVKELGNVQNWAEVLERGFLVLEETVRLANREGSDAGSGSCSCSECGWSEDDEFGEGMMDVDVDLANSLHRQSNMNLGGKEDGPQGENKVAGRVQDEDGDIDVSVRQDDGVRSAWSDASRSLMEPDSSTGTGRAKGSETASMSTESGKDGIGA
ncbi:hypothetical protein QQS21_008504 [Conoideocrella luteorostrata]|uniref:Biogenesis of lysosome-related organelles complex 1 subunit 1 n=1 Tax=Conoideocrella luteorostrata TaxID=1105319 RepID=A0AAJ0CN68_9HYPO|nr:hypothetical protein QQS21_008504 [Conoideocrella luteorostrata]